MSKFNRLAINSVTIASILLASGGVGISAARAAEVVNELTPAISPVDGGVCDVINSHKEPFSPQEISSCYPLEDNPISRSCAANPNSIDCIYANSKANLCNGNAQRPIERRVVGCFEGWDTITHDNGTYGLLEKITGFISINNGATDPDSQRFVREK